jgi:hypothetical protein
MAEPAFLMPLDAAARKLRQWATCTTSQFAIVYRTAASACERLPEVEAQAAALRAALEHLTRCGHGQHLDCPDGEHHRDMVRRALEQDAGRHLLDRLTVARRVVDCGRDVGREDLDETDVAERLANVIDAWDALEAGEAL